MVTDEDWRDSIIALASGVLRRDEPMAKHTTMGVGGPADLWFEPADAKGLSAALEVVRRLRVPYRIIGGGSNLLVGDQGLRGLVIHLTPDFAPVEEAPQADDVVHVTFPAGMTTSAVRRYARERELVGPEFLIGIPGSLGGAIQMNAGTGLGEMVDVVVGAEIVHPEGSRWLDAEAFEFAYRHAVIPPGGLVTRIALRFTRASAEEAIAAQDQAREELRKRNVSQPHGKSAGSIFRNPEGDYAGRLIEVAGLKGRRVGDAVVSEKHANFIMNEGSASAAEILELIQICRDTVRDTSGVNLELEVKLVGEF